MNRQPILNFSYHHIYNRGVDKRHVFLDREDHRRFMLYLNVLNDCNVDQSRALRLLTGEGSTFTSSADKKPLVGIVAFALMDNHYHLLLHQFVDGGISKFMQRLSTAFTMYFNEKYKRSGALFQGRFKNKEISSENYLDQVIRYIHLNPLDILQPGWEEKGIENKKEVANTLSLYEWSSYADALGENRYKEVIDYQLMRECIPDPRTHRLLVGDWIAGERGDFSELD